MELLLIHLGLLFIPALIISYGVSYLRARRTLSTAMVPPSIIFSHCSRGGLLAIRRCLGLPLVAGMTTIVILAVLIQVTPLAELAGNLKRQIILAPSGLVYYTWWGVNLKRHCLKEKRFRDLYN